MSVLSALALFLTAGAAAASRRAGGQDDNSPSRDGRPSERPKRIAELEARVAELEDAIATANAHARRDQELIDLWRERALAAIPGPQAAPQILLHQMAQAQNAAAAQLVQYDHQAQYHQAQQAQQVQYHQAQQRLGQAMGLLGAQMIDAELYCNCVPSRSQVWAANG